MSVCPTLTYTMQHRVAQSVLNYEIFTTASLMALSPHQKQTEHVII